MDEHEVRVNRAAANKGSAVMLIDFVFMGSAWFDLMTGGVNPADDREKELGG